MATKKKSIEEWTVIKEKKKETGKPSNTIQQYESGK